MACFCGTLYNGGDGVNCTVVHRAYEEYFKIHNVLWAYTQWDSFLDYLILILIKIIYAKYYTLFSLYSNVFC